MAKPKLALIPAAQGSKFYSVLPSSGVGDFTFSRSGSATRINSKGLIETVTDGVSRLNYPLIDGEVVGCPHHILEPERRNLITYSEDFTQWSTNATITPNSAISPDGTLNASLFSHSGGSFPQVALSGITFVSGADYIPSLYVKSDGTSQVQHSLLVNNVVVNFTPTTEWVRISDLIVSPDTSGSFVIAQNSGSSVPASFYIWGAQLEQGSYPTSYIPNNGEVNGVTRSAETANGSGDASTFNDSEGVLMVEISGFSSDATANDSISIRGASNDNRLYIYRSSSDNKYGFAVFSGSSLECNIKSNVVDFSENVKIAVKYKANDFALYLNGTEVNTHTSGSTPIGLSELSFDVGGGSNHFYGNTKQLQYFDSALTDSELQALTS